MATIYKEIMLRAAPDIVWDVVRDVGAVHTRFARDFVTNTVLTGDVRTVTFANGFVARERLVALDQEHRRLAYALVDGTTTHHSASFQVFEGPDGGTRLLWITDLLPDGMLDQMTEMVEWGSAAIQRTLESAASTAGRR